MRGKERKGVGGSVRRRKERKRKKERKGGISCFEKLCRKCLSEALLHPDAEIVLV